MGDACGPSNLPSVKEEGEKETDEKKEEESFRDRGKEKETWGRRGTIKDYVQM